MPPRWPRGRTSRRLARIAAVHSSTHLPDEQHQRPGDVEAVGEEGAVAGVGALLGLDPADGEDRPRRPRPRAGCRGWRRRRPAARRPVTRRRSISAQSAGAEQVIIRPLSFSTQRKAGMSSLEPSRMPGLARAGLRGEVRLPLGQPVAVLGDPARHVRGAAVAHRVLEHRQREPVDLEEDDPRRVGPRLAALAPGDPPDHPQRVLVVVVGAGQHLEDDRDRGDHQRGEQRVAERVDGEEARGRPRRRRPAPRRRRAGRAGSRRPA